MFRRMIVAVAMLAMPVLAAEPPSSVTRFIAHARIPSILGHPEAGYVELYEFDMWLNEAGLSEAYVRRCGAPPYENITHDGYCPFDVLPGRYVILMHQPEWFLRPAVVPDVVIKAGSSDERDIIPGLDYACASGTKLGPWETPDGPKPWAPARVFHQTFVARGTSITHAHYKLAGADAESTRVSIHKVTDDRRPERWPQVGPDRIDDHAGTLNDNWVGWRSGEVITVPGQRYALRIEGVSKGRRAGLSMVVHHNAVGPGYDNGTAYADEAPQSYDLYATLSSDSDGTVIPYMRIHDIKPGGLAGWGTWSQTWVARGKSLAAVDFLVAWTEDMKGVCAQALIHEDSPKGAIIGPAKRTHTAWWGPGHGFLGAAWLPGEVQLTPGKRYCVEFQAVQPCKGYSAGTVNHPNNAYPDGMAFRDGKPVPDADLEMTIVEYDRTERQPEPPAPYEPKGRNLLVNGDFEQGEPSQSDAKDPPGWTRWSKGKTAYWYGPYGRNKSKAARVIGGNINGTAIDGGYVQRVTGLSPTQRYRLSGWTASGAQTDKRYTSAVGYDTTGQATDPDAGTIVWGATGRYTLFYEQIVFDDIKPKGDAISVWTRGANKEVGGCTFTVDFDDFALVEEGTPPR